MTARHHALLPVLATLSGLAIFSLMDGFMKTVALAIGAYAGVFWRNLVGAGMMAPLWLWRGQGWPGRAALRLHLLRGTVAACMAVLFFHGLVLTPLAEAMALSFIAPLIALYLAAVMLGEKVGRRAVAGSVLGLAGVVVIGLGKFGGGGNSTASLEGLAAILASAVLYAWNLVLQRQQAQLAGPEEIAFFQAATIALVLGLGAPWFAPVPGHGVWLWLVGAAVLAAASLMLLSWAYARAEAQVLVPLEYTAFIWAALTGYAFFREPVTAATLGGVVLIVAGCLWASPRQDKAEIPA